MIGNVSRSIFRNVSSSINNNCVNKVGCRNHGNYRCDNPHDPICPRVFAAFFSGLLTGYCINLVVSH